MKRIELTQRENLEQLWIICSLETKHNIKQESEGMSCDIICCSSFSKRDPACKEWRKARCVPKQVEPTVPQYLHIDLPVDTVIHIGDNTIHATHRLSKYKGLIYCKTCWALDINQARYLAELCQPPKVTGLRNVMYMAAGKKPAGMSKWPEEMYIHVYAYTP